MAVLSLPVFLVPAFMPGTVGYRPEPPWNWLAVGGRFLTLVTLAHGAYPCVSKVKKNEVRGSILRILRTPFRGRRAESEG